MLEISVALLKKHSFVFLLALCSAVAFTEFGFFGRYFPLEELFSLSGLFYFALQSVLVSVAVWIFLNLLDIPFWKAVTMPLACIVSIAFGLVPLAYVADGVAFNPLVSLAAIMFGVQIMKT